MQPGTCVVQYDNRTKKRLGAQYELMELNRLKCEADPNCTYTRYTHIAENRPVYWEKVFTVRDHMMENPQCKTVLFLDSDAVMNKTPILDAKKHMTIAPDSEDPFRVKSFLDKHNSGLKFNAGVFALKNTETGQRIMSEWTDQYDETRWSYGDGKWMCDKCPWAGPEYEQGAFADKILPLEREHIRSMPSRVMNNNKCNEKKERDVAEVCHFYFNKKTGIPAYLNANDVMASKIDTLETIIAEGAA